MACMRLIPPAIGRIFPSSAAAISPAASVTVFGSIFAGNIRCYLSVFGARCVTVARLSLDYPGELPHRALNSNEPT